MNSIAIDREPASGAVVASVPPPPASDACFLRLIACGSVDDGKSTLIGRLLHEAGRVPDDERAALARASASHGTRGGEIDYALLLDGLDAEREQGITIDVAWRHLQTAKRRFLIADCPGHVQYTRNMATGASHADVAIMLVDARHGVKPQTRRHAAILGLLGVRRVILAVNKMDLVGGNEARFRDIEAEFRALTSHFAFGNAVAIPVIATDGDNVARSSSTMSWYEGPTLIEAKTYRRKGHAEHDNQSYVPKGEIEDWAARNDPLDRYILSLQDQHGFDAAEISAIDQRVQQEIDAATDEAEKSPFPEPRDCLIGVYHDPPEAPVLWYREGVRSAVEKNERAQGWGTYDR